MTTQDLISVLERLNPKSEIQIRDLNGLLWTLEPHQLIVDDDSVTIDTKHINEISF